MKIVAFTDHTFPDLEIERAILQPFGCELLEGQCKDVQALVELTAHADYIITQFAPIDASVIDGMKKARLIVRCGVGVDNVDMEAARRKHIPVCNVPDYCTHEVADHTVALILALTRQLYPNFALVRGGRWGLGVPLERMRVLKDMVAGIVGFGRIGRQVARRLVAFGCGVLAFDPAVDEATVRLEGVVPVPFESLLAEADLISLHCSCNDETRHIINRQSLAKTKPGVFVVNTGRGALIETAALIEALEKGHVAGAALDVLHIEPPPPDNPLLGMDNVIFTGHIAYASARAEREVRETAASLIVLAINGDLLPNVVNGVTHPRPDIARAGFRSG